MRDLGLSGKVVLITGGGGVLGSAFARGFLEFGSRVAIADFAPEKAEKIAAQLKAENRAVIGVGADVTRENQVEKMVPMSPPPWAQSTFWSTPLRCRFIPARRSPRSTRANGTMCSTSA